MQEEINVWFEDIEKAIIEIDSFLPSPRNFFEFERNLMAKRAIERNIEIIGEAMNRILMQNPTILISNSRNIVDARNRIIHGYDTISDDIIWLIATKYIPILKDEIDNLKK